MKKLTIISLVLLVLVTYTGCKSDTEKIIGIKIYEYANDFNLLIDKWKEMGVNTAFVSEELAANKSFRQLLKDNNIQVYLIFPVFFNPERLQQDSSLYAITDKGGIASDDWVEFICPSRTAYRKSRVDDAADLIRALEPDGLSIDFIRQFVFWEMIYPDRTAESIDAACFCDSCIVGFCKLRGITLPDTCITVQHKAAYLMNLYPGEWDEYRCDLITSMVKDLSDKAHSVKPDIKINVHAVPWRDEDFGGANIRVAAQDLQKIAPYTDFISPMCYSQMLRRDVSWIGSVVTEMDNKAPGKILPSIQVYPYYIDDPFSVEDFRECVDVALQEPSQGIVFFSWPLFEKDSVRMEFR